MESNASRKEYAGREITYLRETKNYSRAAAARAIGVPPISLRAAEFGGTCGNTSVSLTKIEAILSLVRDLPTMPAPLPPRPKRKSVNVPTRIYANASRCRGEECGIVIFRTVAEIPSHWVTHWHISVNGYCPACARRYGFGDLVRQKAEEIRGGTDYERLFCQK